MAADITIPAQRGPGLYYVSTERFDGTVETAAIDRAAVEDPRERALCRALLTHALAEIDRTEPVSPSGVAQR